MYLANPPLTISFLMKTAFIRQKPDIGGWQICSEKSFWGGWGRDPWGGGTERRASSLEKDSRREVNATFTLGDSLGAGQAWSNLRQDLLAVKFNHPCFLFSQLPVHHDKRHKPLRGAQEVFHFSGQLHTNTFVEGSPPVRKISASIFGFASTVNQILCTRSPTNPRWRMSGACSGDIHSPSGEDL
jgi:hypothetical protein